MSRRPGIGRFWLDKYMGNTYSHDNVVLEGGVVCQPPKYYDSVYESLSPLDMQRIKDVRKEKSKLFSYDNSRPRLTVREKVKFSKLKLLSRKLDGDY